MAIEVTSLIQTYPHYSIIVLSALVSLFITIVNYFIMDKDRMREIKAKQKELQAQAKVHQKEGNHDKMMASQKEMMSYTGEMMKQSFKPMLVTIIPLLILFGWLRATFAVTVIAKTWLWYYIGCSIVFSIFLRKLFRLQ